MRNPPDRHPGAPPGAAQPGRPSDLDAALWRDPDVARSLGDTWEARRSRRHWSNERYRMSLLLRHNLRPGQDLVDVGCGPGFYVPVYLEGVGPAQTHLVDRSGQMLEHCRSRYADLLAANLHTGSIHDIPLPDGRFDVVVNCDVLMHVPHYRRALAELHRICNPSGGRIFLRVNFTDGPTYGDLPQDPDPDPDRIYWIAYNRREFRQALDALGPSSVEIIDRICRKPFKRGGDPFQADAAIVVLTRGVAAHPLRKGTRLGHLVSKLLHSAA